MSCIFCEIKEYILENELAYAIYDKFPVGKGHMLFIPKRHVKDFFDITNEERDA
ncbi:HIT family protein, partial [Romboutsia sp.]|uniref:HIT family protein n=1 Tax=Romboutsia sp. TaxID=1965302 RepID=UPI003F38EA66